MVRLFTKKQKQDGVSLVEVLFAVVIMSTLILLSINEYQKSTFRNQITQLKSSIEQLQMAMENYYSDNCAKAGSTVNFGITYNGITPYLVNPYNIENPWRGSLALENSYVPSLIPFVKGTSTTQPTPPLLVLTVKFPGLPKNLNSDKQNIVLAELKPTSWGFSTAQPYIEFTFPPTLGQGQEQLGVGLADVQEFVKNNPVPAGTISGVIVHPPCNSYYQ